MPQLSDVDHVEAWVERRRALFSSGRYYLHVAPPAGARSNRRSVRYCARVRPVLQTWVMDRLTKLPGKAEPGAVGPDQAGPGGAGPDQVDPGGAGPDQVGPGGAGP